MYRILLNSLLPVSFFLLVLSVSSAAQPTALKKTDFISMTVSGELKELEQISQGDSLWTLASKTLAVRSGLDAKQAWTKLSDASNPADIRSLALSRLMGYYQLVGDRSRMEKTRSELSNFAAHVKKLYPDGLPKPLPADKPVVAAKPKPAQVQQTTPTLSPSGAYSIQVGAFGSRANADRKASQLRKKGYTVHVVKLDRKPKPLYAVRVGEFDSKQAASQFGRKKFGKEGKDFRVTGN